MRIHTNKRIYHLFSQKLHVLHYIYIFISIFYLLYNTFSHFGKAQKKYQGKKSMKHSHFYPQQYFFSLSRCHFFTFQTVSIMRMKRTRFFN